MSPFETSRCLHSKLPGVSLDLRIGPEVVPRAHYEVFAVVAIVSTTTNASAIEVKLQVPHHAIPKVLVSEPVAWACVACYVRRARVVAERFVGASKSRYHSFFF